MKAAPWANTWSLFSRSCQVLDLGRTNELILFSLFGKAPGVGAVTGTERSRAVFFFFSSSVDACVFLLWYWTWNDCKDNWDFGMTWVVRWIGQSAFCDCDLSNLDVQILCNMLEPCSTKLFLLVPLPLLALLLLFLICIVVSLQYFFLFFCICYPQFSIIIAWFGDFIAHAPQKDRIVCSWFLVCVHFIEASNITFFSSNSLKDVLNLISLRLLKHKPILF